MTKLTVSLAQMSVVRSKPEENLKKGEVLIAEAARRGSDIICFPEMWTTGFDWAANKRIVPEQQKTLEIIGGMARRYHIWINGSMLAMDEDGNVSNTSILFDSNGKKLGTYRKTHLFSLLHEERHMAAGKSLCVVETPWGLAGLSICYDIRFPELFRTYALKGVKILLLPAAFPYPRLPHWKVLVRARAIENQMFVLATNQVGAEDFGKEGTATYFGNSVIVDPWGETIIEAGESQKMLLTATIDVAKVDEVRSKMRVLQDRRPELYELA
jgi:omega-amidase